MKRYDFPKIHQFIEARKQSIKEAVLGMREDWFWTAETVFEGGDYKIDLLDAGTKIGGITGSLWATPTLLILSVDGDEFFLDAYFGSNQGGTNPLAFGVMSGPAQEEINGVEIRGSV